MITRDEVVERLRNDPKDLSPLHEYLDMREAQVQTEREGLELIFETAHIYRDAGMDSAGRDALDDAIMQSFEMGDDELNKRAIEERFGPPTFPKNKS